MGNKLLLYWFKTITTACLHSVNQRVYLYENVSFKFFVYGVNSTVIRSQDCKRPMNKCNSVTISLRKLLSFVTANVMKVFFNRFTQYSRMLEVTKVVVSGIQCSYREWCGYE